MKKNINKAKKISLTGIGQKKLIKIKKIYKNF